MVSPDVKEMQDAIYPIIKRATIEDQHYLFKIMNLGAYIPNLRLKYEHNSTNFSSKLKNDIKFEMNGYFYADDHELPQLFKKVDRLVTSVGGDRDERNRALPRQGGQLSDLRKYFLHQECQHQRGHHSEHRVPRDHGHPSGPAGHQVHRRQNQPAAQQNRVRQSWHVEGHFSLHPTLWI
jgi:hypothetical protein